MGLRIQTNVSSIAAQRALSVQQKRSEHSAMAMASGNRIVNAADDAAGLAISETMKADIRSITAARTNAFNAVSAIQVGEGSLAEITNILGRVRELGVQAASDTVGEKERGYLNNEAKALVEELDRIAKTTKFGDKKLLDGSNSELEFHVGTASGSDNIITFKDALNSTSSELGLEGISLESKSDARDVLSSVDEAFDKVNSMRASFGSIQSRLQSTVSNLDVAHENLSAAKSRMSDADIAKETSEMTSANILQNAAVSVLAQANQFPSVALKLL